MKIDAKGMHYKELNKMIAKAIEEGEKTIDLINVNGQRYIARSIREKVQINIDGVPGNDLAIFLNGATIFTNSNAQDGVANTMNEGKVVIRGDASDILGYGMRGGKLFIRGNAGYRVGIHMKAFNEKKPVIIVGGTAADFFGEYMAGGIMIVLGLDKRDAQPLVGNYVGTGMHGGVIYIRGEVEPHQLGKEVDVYDLDEEDEKELRTHLGEYCKEFNLDLEETMSKKFIKLIPVSHRPYGVLYSY
jgi:glutamate synthase domain-containing protein 3